MSYAAAVKRDVTVPVNASKAVIKGKKGSPKFVAKKFVPAKVYEPRRSWQGGKIRGGKVRDLYFT